MQWEAYFEASRTSTIELFCEKNSIIDVRLDSKHAGSNNKDDTSEIVYGVNFEHLQCINLMSLLVNLNMHLKWQPLLFRF